MTAAVVGVATWISSSRGIKVSSPTNSVSRASRGLCRNVWQRDLSAPWSVTYGRGEFGCHVCFILLDGRWHLVTAEARYC